MLLRFLYFFKWNYFSLIDVFIIYFHFISLFIIIIIFYKNYMLSFKRMNYQFPFRVHLKKISIS